MKGKVNLLLELESDVSKGLRIFKKVPIRCRRERDVINSERNVFDVVAFTQLVLVNQSRFTYMFTAVDDRVDAARCLSGSVTRHITDTHFNARTRRRVKHLLFSFSTVSPTPIFTMSFVSTADWGDQ